MMPLPILSSRPSPRVRALRGPRTGSARAGTHRAPLRMLIDRMGPGSRRSRGPPGMTAKEKERASPPSPAERHQVALVPPQRHPAALLGREVGVAVLLHDGEV